MKPAKKLVRGATKLASTKNGQTRSGQVQARIAHIVSLMRDGTWRHGVSVQKLAIEWSLTKQRVRELTMEASRVVHAELEDPQSIRIDVGMALRRVLYKAEATGDLKNIIAAVKAIAWYTGTAAPQKIQVTEVPLSAMPEEERERLIEEAIAVLAKERVKR